MIYEDLRYLKYSSFVHYLFCEFVISLTVIFHFLLLHMFPHFHSIYIALRRNEQFPPIIKQALLPQIKGSSYHTINQSQIQKIGSFKNNDDDER